MTTLAFPLVTRPFHTGAAYDTRPFHTGAAYDRGSLMTGAR